MKLPLALLALALMLAGCTNPDESDDANDGGNADTGSDRGSEVSGTMEVVDNSSDGGAGNETNTTGSG